MGADRYLILGAPGAIRTPDPLVRSQILYPTELRVRISLRCVSAVNQEERIIMGFSRLVYILVVV